MTIWKRKFVWIPEHVETGDRERFGWRWLTFVWYRLVNGEELSRYESYWKPATHKWDSEDNRC
jgi:hypothetical protein